MIVLLVLVSLSLLLAALWLFLWAQRRWRRSGLPRGRLVYADTAGWSAVSRPYYAHRYRLTGKPDYLVDTPQGVVPVEVKGTTCPPGGQAYDSHVMQLAAYCLLVEEADGRPPPYGLIRYTDATVQVDYTEALREVLLDRLAALRDDANRRGVQRSHEEPERCRACGVRHACGREAMV